MRKFTKKILLFLILSLYNNSTYSFDLISISLTGFNIIYTIYQTLINNKIHIKDNNLNEIKIKYCKYLNEEHTKKLFSCLIPEYNMLKESDSYVTPILTTLKSLHEKDYFKTIGYFIGNYILAIGIKKIARTNQMESTKEKILKELFKLNEDNKEFITEHSYFFMNYIKLIIYPSNTNTLLLERLHPIYLKLIDIEKLIKESEKLNISTIKEFNNKLKNITNNNKRTSNNDYFFSIEFTKEIDHQYTTLKSILDNLKEIEVQIIPTIKKIIKNENFDSYEIKELYEKYLENKKISDSNLFEESIKNFKNKIIEKINLATKFLEIPEIEKHNTLYLEILNSYNNIKGLSHFEINLNKILNENKLNIKDSSSEIEKKYTKLKLEFKSMEKCILTIGHIKNLKESILLELKIYNGIIKKPIFKNYLPNDFHDKNYYHFTFNELEKYETELKNKKEKTIKEFNLLLNLNNKLNEFFINNKKLDELFSEIQSLNIFHEIANTEEYKNNYDEYNKLKTILLPHTSSINDSCLLEIQKIIEKSSNIKNKTEESLNFYKIYENFKTQSNTQIQKLENTILLSNKYSLKETISLISKNRDFTIKEKLNDKSKNILYIEKTLSNEMHKIKIYCENAANEYYKLLPIISSIRKELNELEFKEIFTIEEKNTIKKKYNHIINEIEFEFNNFLFKHSKKMDINNFNNEKYNTRKNNLIKVIYTLGIHKENIKNLIKVINEQEQEFNNEYQEIQYLLNLYNISPPEITLKKFTYEIINIKKEIKSPNINKEIENYDINEPPIEFSLPSMNKLTVKYNQHRKNNAKITCNLLKQYLTNKIKNSTLTDAERIEMENNIKTKFNECNDKVCESENQESPIKQIAEKTEYITTQLKALLNKKTKND